MAHPIDLFTLQEIEIASAVPKPIPALAAVVACCVDSLIGVQEPELSTKTNRYARMAVALAGSHGLKANGTVSLSARLSQHRNERR